jgi:integrase
VVFDPPGHRLAPAPRCELDLFPCQGVLAVQAIGALRVTWVAINGDPYEVLRHGLGAYVAELTSDQGVIATVAEDQAGNLMLNHQRRCRITADDLRRSAGLEWLRLHDLRHAFATFLLDQREELRTVMELVGHSTIRLTADTYGLVLPARARQATEAIDRLLGGTG